MTAKPGGMADRVHDFQVGPCGPCHLQKFEGYPLQAEHLLHRLAGRAAGEAHRQAGDPQLGQHFGHIDALAPGVLADRGRPVHPVDAQIRHGDGLVQRRVHYHSINHGCSSPLPIRSLDRTALSCLLVLYYSCRPLAK